MEKQSDTIFEVREEFMVSPTGGDPTVRKAHFLKPTFTANNGEISELPPGKHVFPVAIHLARGTRVALAPAVLSSIYRDLGVLKDQLFGSNVLQIIGELNLYAPFQLVQLWLWERFPGLRPMPNSIKHGEPRVARWQWHRLQKNVDDMKLDIGFAGTEFQWRPYTLAVNGWTFPKFYGDKEQYIPLDSHLDEEVKSFAICLRVSELVGLESMEQYLPHRVAMQFGMDQDLPGCFVRCNRKPEIVWRNYNRPMGDAEIYIPPRLFESDVTVTYSDWWKQSIKAQCDVIKQFVKRPGSTRELLNVSKRKKESHILSPHYPLKWGEVSRGESAKKNGGVETGDLIEEEMEDGLTIQEFFALTKHNSKKIDGETESRLCAQSPLPSTKEIETPVATIKPGEVSRAAPFKDQNDVILENVSNGDNIGYIVAGDSLPL
ncbi:hypothetical protein CCACVL1_00097 [Corchorus capsularis]|uniref:Aminotransferase-like plant mobile domain-containing protein n=1 Tax=Corchorus capsularis TaxID=210143 RepID=A0A1R3KYP4_COCAP|nr:hypothetical protein CCACVL1_00097 [Corchorus capsularis]